MTMPVCAIRPRWVLIGAWGVVILYAFPGYLNWDSGEQIWQARRAHFAACALCCRAFRGERILHPVSKDPAHTAGIVAP